MDMDAASSMRQALEEAGYLADPEIATVVYLAEKLQKPLLVEGPAGVGKTELAKAIARIQKVDLLRLQCYEGVDENKTLYEWNYRKQLLRIQAGQEASWDELSDDIFSEAFLLERPVLKAIRSDDPIVFLIDEVDKLDLEAEALLLEVLSDWQVTIPELGTIRSRRVPFVVLTSNNVRELSEALKRRCLYLYIDYPDVEREKQILLARVPGIDADLAEEAARVVRSIRSLELKKPPSIAESIDWARTLVLFNATTLDDDLVASTLSVLLKYESDLKRVRSHLKLEPTS